VLTLQTRGLTKLAALFSSAENAEAQWRPLGGALFILVVWHTVRLINLKAFNRWLAIVSFVWATVSITWFTILTVPNVPKPFAPIAMCIVIGMLNLTCAFYLVNRPFREFAVRFNSEREKEKNSRMMQKASRKAMLKEFKG